MLYQLVKIYHNQVISKRDFRLKSLKLRKFKIFMIQIQKTNQKLMMTILLMMSFLVLISMQLVVVEAELFLAQIHLNQKYKIQIINKKLAQT